jgi:hypothetical protein
VYRERLIDWYKTHQTAFDLSVLANYIMVMTVTFAKKLPVNEVVETLVLSTRL